MQTLPHGITSPNRLVIMLSLSYFCFYMPIFVVTFLASSLLSQLV